MTETPGLWPASHLSRTFPNLVWIRAIDWPYDLVAVLCLLAFTARRWLLIGPYPPGLDGAQWLAIGRGFHGFGRSSQSAYAPLVPLLATVAEALLGPLPSLRLLAVGSTLALSLAVWLVARSTLGSSWGFAAAAVAIPSSALAEPVFYGGYPQQLALAAGILAIWGTCRYLIAGEIRSLWVVGIGAFLSAAAHHIYFPLMLLSLLATILFWLSASRQSAHWTLLPPLFVSLVPACLLFGIVTYQFMLTGYAAPLTATARAPWEAWQYATRESPQLWLILFALGVGSLAATWRRRREQGWLLSSALLVPSSILLLALGQPRLGPPMLIGIALAVAFGGQSLIPHHLPQPAAALAAMLIPLALILPADQAATTFADFYRVVDEPLVQAAAVVATQDSPGAVAVRKDHRGWPIGWWLEALQPKPVFTGSDLDWLGFPDEQRRAIQVASLFDGALNATSFRDRASALGVRYLVIPKWDWIGWDRWLADSQFPVSVLYDDDRYLVLRVEDT